LFWDLINFILNRLGTACPHRPSSKNLHLNVEVAKGHDFGTNASQPRHFEFFFGQFELFLRLLLFLLRFPVLKGRYLVLPDLSTFLLLFVEFHRLLEHILLRLLEPFSDSLNKLSLFKDFLMLVAVVVVEPIQGAAAAADYLITLVSILILLKLTAKGLIAVDHLLHLNTLHRRGAGRHVARSSDRCLTDMAELAFSV